MPASKGFTFHPIRLGKVNCFLYYSQGKAMLVDCGTPGSERRILEEISRLGIEFSCLKLLVLTHAHYDHAGSSAALKERTGCRIMIHREEENRLRSGYTGLPGGTRWKAKILIGLGRLFARRMGKYPPACPDILAGDEVDLESLGFPAKVFHMPGHTPGSMVVSCETGELVTGDSVFNWEGKQLFPPFAENLPDLVESWKVIRNLDASLFYPAHGEPVTRERFLNEYEDAMQRYGKRKGGLGKAGGL